VEEGNLLRVKLVNQLTEPVTIHWHGIPLPNEMDGVPGITQSPVKPGETFTYEFLAEDTGTYIYHRIQGYSY
jgi:FtsP/CotA-like multicopper oxidase with cupredoxin domain